MPRNAVYAVLAAVALVSECHGHGFLVTPMPRSVLHNGGSAGPGDIQSLSGGGVPTERANGHGLCGDTAARREFMAPNQFGPSFPTQATYNEGQTIDIEVQITAHHWGWFEFRLCRPADGGLDTSVPITQECLNEHVLEFDLEHTQQSYNGEMRNGVSSPADYEGDTTKYSLEHVKCPYIEAPDGSCCNGGGSCSAPESNRDRWVLPDPAKTGTLYSMRYRLPAGVTCERCVLQWYYQTGNSPDSYPEGFWNCADITILPTGQPTPPAPEPTPPVPSPVPEPTPPTPPAPTPPAPSPTPTGCHSLVSHISDEWCQGVGCAAAYAAFCSQGTAPAPAPSPPAPPPAPAPEPTPPAPVPEPTPPAPEPTPTAPAPEPTPPTGCHSLVSHISDEWCQGVGCAPAYAAFCSQGAAPAPEPTPPAPAPEPTPSTPEPTPPAPEPEPTTAPVPAPTPLVPAPTPTGCYSLVSHISDEWCQGVGCAAAYAAFCSQGTAPAPAPAPEPTPPVPVPEPTPPSPAPVPTPTPAADGLLDIVGYHGNSGNAVAYIPLLEDVACYYNVIILTFANFLADGSLELEMQGPYSNDLERLKTDITSWRARPDPFGRTKRVLFSIGGQNGRWPGELASSTIEATVLDFVSEFDLDGLDIDLEGSAVEEASSLSGVVSALQAAGKIVSAAPEAAQGPLDAYAGVLSQLDYYHPQFYNNGPNAVTTPYTPAQSGAYQSPPATWQSPTPSSYSGAGQPWWVTVLDTSTAHFGMPASKRGMLIPATPDAAGNNNVWDLELLQSQVAASGIRYVGTWALAYDKRNNWAFGRTMAALMDPSVSC